MSESLQNRKQTMWSWSSVTTTQQSLFGLKSIAHVVSLLVLNSLFIVHSAWGNQCFGQAINDHPGLCGDDSLKCPWYRNLARHVPVQDDSCPMTDKHWRKYGNCVSDQDCCVGSYCCFAICQGISRCYNPYINKFTDNLHEFTGSPACPVTQNPCAKNDTGITRPTATPSGPALTTTTATTKTTPTPIPITKDPRSGDDYDSETHYESNGAAFKAEEAAG